MSSQKFRLTLLRFSQEVSERDAIKIAKMYGLDGSTQDRISRSDPGLTLLTALEQRRILYEDEKAVNKFCQDLYDLGLDHLVEQFKKFFPNLTAKPLPRQSRLPATQSVGRSDAGNVVSGTSDQVRAHHQSAREDVPENVVGTDVSDRALSELSNYIGDEWQRIAIESLSLKSYNIAELNEDYKKFRDKVYAMFVMWRKKNAGNATTTVLLEKLQARSDVEMEALDALRKYL